MKLGWCDVCINVENLKKSRDFYETLGLEVVEGNWDDGYFVMKNDAIRIGLYKGHFEGFMFNFRGGDVFKNSEVLCEKGLGFKFEPQKEKDGSTSATLLDPDGNIIFLNTYPAELEPEYQKKVGVL